MNTCHNNTTDICVSIHCLVYNQEPYLRECLNGFVNQITNFRYEAIVHDDVSTDNSATIIREYAEKYPDVIKPIYETENQWSKHDGSLDRIMLNACRGKYIAFCEGDDYWTDPNKLQNQVDFMEMHPHCSMTFHRADVLYEVNTLSGTCKDFQKIDKRKYKGVELFAKWMVPTASIVCRRDVLESAIYQNSIKNPNFIFGDILLVLSSAECGEVWGLDKTMCVYRRHEGGASVGILGQRALKHANHYLEIWKVFGEDYKNAAIDKYVKVITSQYVISWIKRLKGQKNEQSLMIRDVLFEYPYYTIKNLIKSMVHSIIVFPMKKYCLPLFRVNY